jgi:hypothetical protein
MCDLKRESGAHRRRKRQRCGKRGAHDKQVEKKKTMTKGKGGGGVANTVATQQDAWVEEDEEMDQKYFCDLHAEERARLCKQE